MSDKAVRVLLVDDDPLVRMGLRLMFGGAPGIEVAGEVGDGADVADPGTAVAWCHRSGGDRIDHVRR